jgi:hypothetical protein
VREWHDYKSLKPAIGCGGLSRVGSDVWDTPVDSGARVPPLRVLTPALN